MYTREKLILAICFKRTLGSLHSHQRWCLLFGQRGRIGLEGLDVRSRREHILLPIRDQRPASLFINNYFIYPDRHMQRRMPSSACLTAVLTHPGFSQFKNDGVAMLQPSFDLSRPRMKVYLTQHNSNIKAETMYW
jgi:hypothetical protein